MDFQSIVVQSIATSKLLATNMAFVHLISVFVSIFFDYWTAT